MACGISDKATSKGLVKCWTVAMIEGVKPYTWYAFSNFFQQTLYWQNYLFTHLSMF